MNKEYRDITEISLGATIDSVIKRMKSIGELVSVDFNGVTLYSDTDDIDSAYKKVVGMTKVRI